MTKRISDRFSQKPQTLVHVALVSLVLILAGFTSIAQAQDGDLSQRLERLERDIQTLSKMVVRGPDSVPSTEVPGRGSSVPDRPLPQNAIARIGVRLDAMESELRDVTGRIEELTFNMGQLTQRVERLVADVDFRLTGLEQQIRPGAIANRPTDAAGLGAGDVAAGLAGETPSTTSSAPLPGSVQVVGQGPTTLGQIEAERVPEAGAPGATGTPAEASISAGAPTNAQPPAGAVPGSANISRTAVPRQVPAPRQLTPQGTAASAAPQQASLPTGTPDEQYKFAFGLLRKHQFDQAEGAFREFLEKNSDNKLSGNARYWLAETHYARAEYVKAAETFLQAYETAPEGNKAPDSLLKLAMSLGQLGQSKEACGAISKLFVDYPNANSSLKRTAARQQRQLNCK